MAIYSKKHFLTDIKFTLVPIVTLSLSLVACNHQDDSGAISNLEMKNDNSTAQLDEEYQVTTLLSQDLDSLVMEKSLDLSISQNGSDFVPANYSFSQRIIDFLGSFDATITKVIDDENYDLVLKFDGYHDIHLNLGANTYWFAGTDHLYSMNYSFSDQWDRYMIRVVNGGLIYDSFEKTILSKILFSDADGRENVATVFYDGDVRLSVNDEQIAIESNISEHFLSYNNSIVPPTSYSINTVGEQTLIAIVNDFATVKGSNAKLDIFTYNNGIHPVFSTSDMLCELNTIDFENQEVTIGLPFADTTMTYLLTNEEIIHSDEKLQEFIQSNMEIDDAYIKTIKDGIFCAPIEITFLDGENGVEEILISTAIHSIGTRMPLWIRANVVFIFEVKDNLIQYKDVKR